jgi:uncharacterized RDD family membrane protein YckC
VSEASLDQSQLLRRFWRRIAPPIVVSVFYFGVLVYPAIRIWMLVNPAPPGTPTLLVIMVGPLLGRLALQ